MAVLPLPRLCRWQRDSPVPRARAARVRGAVALTPAPDAAQERKVKAQKDACDNLIEWLVKHWAKLLGVYAAFLLHLSAALPRMHAGCALSVWAYPFMVPDDNVQLPSYRDHPADQLLIICLDLFDKCKDAKTAAQQELPMKM
jgi:hypothetical protein